MNNVLGEMVLGGCYVQEVDDPRIIYLVNQATPVSPHNSQLEHR